MPSRVVQKRSSVLSAAIGMYTGSRVDQRLTSLLGCSRPTTRTRVSCSRPSQNGCASNSSPIASPKDRACAASTATSSNPSAGAGDRPSTISDVSSMSL